MPTLACVLLISNLVTSAGWAQQEAPGSLSEQSDAAVVEQVPPASAEGVPESATHALSQKAPPVLWEALPTAQAMAVLRAIEARLSVGERPSSEEQDALIAMLHAAESPQVRALAAAILPWLGAEASAAVLLDAIDDPEPQVRSQALLGLLALAHHFSPDVNEIAANAGVRLLYDPSDEVACHSARLLMATNPALAPKQLRAHAAKVSDVRYGCWRKLVALPERAIHVQLPIDPQAPPSRRPSLVPSSSSSSSSPKTSFSLPVSAGNGLFWASAGSTGLLVGALLGNTFFPAHDTLTYTRVQTKFSRQEPSVWLGVGGGLVGAAALGGGAYALTHSFGALPFASGAAVAATTTAASLGGLGVGMAFGFNTTGLGLSVMGMSLTGLAASSAMAYVAPPDDHDLAMLSAMGAMGALAGTLGSFAAVPVALPVLFGRVPRADFAVGTGMMSAAGFTLVGLGISPLVDANPGRVLASTTAATLGAAVGTGLAYALTPISVDVRGRVAAGAGVTLQLALGVAAYFLVPDAWAARFARTKSGGALVLDDSGLNLGLPQVSALAPARKGDMPGLSLNLLAGRF